MAYVNVLEWKTDQVYEWLKGRKSRENNGFVNKRTYLPVAQELLDFLEHVCFFSGLDNCIQPYIHSFVAHNINGQLLLSLSLDDLHNLGIVKLGHQEIILEAVEYLCNFHYDIDRENVQLLALRLSCKAHSLYNELVGSSHSEAVTTQTLSDVATIISTVKPLVRWLDAPPFSGQLDYNEKKMRLLKLSLEMATCAQRDRFAENPIKEIKQICSELTDIADYIIQEITDPMILQPATLDLVTIKKPGDDLGFYILPSYHGAHQITEIKFGSAAHQCGKIEDRDEIVQVNYQTVVGWERNKVLELFRENPDEVLLTLKRRPRHTKIYGQIYIKPYRLPSNKKILYSTRWQHNIPSPRPELLSIADFVMPLPKNQVQKSSREKVDILDTIDTNPGTADMSESDDSEIEPLSTDRLYLPKSRNLIQRRATITGACPTSKYGINIEKFWRELKQEKSTSLSLQDKAVSCARGLNAASRMDIASSQVLRLGVDQVAKQENYASQFEDSRNDHSLERKTNTMKQTDETSMHVRKAQTCDKITSNDVRTEHSKSEDECDVSSKESRSLKLNNNPNYRETESSPCKNESIVHPANSRSSHDQLPTTNFISVLPSMIKKTNSFMAINECADRLLPQVEVVTIKPHRPPEGKCENFSMILQTFERSSKLANKKELSSFEPKNRDYGSFERKNRDLGSFESRIRESSLFESTARDTIPFESKIRMQTIAEPEKRTKLTPPEPPKRRYFSSKNSVSTSEDEDTSLFRKQFWIKNRIDVDKSQEMHRSQFYLEQYKPPSDSIKYNTSIPKPTENSPSMKTSSSCLNRSKSASPISTLKEKSEMGTMNRAFSMAKTMSSYSSYHGKSPRTLRKKNSLIAKRRNIQVKDLNPSDLEGWLTYRGKGAGGTWARAWFVLKYAFLYRFESLNSQRATCLISLTGYTVSQASEVKSRKYAFKVYHTGTVFYFSADSEDLLSNWLDAINKATLGNEGGSGNSELYSETDDSDSENCKSKNASTPSDKQSSISECGFGSLKKLVRRDGTSLDRKYLKFLRSKSQNCPVPTEQFRSYRRVLPSSFDN